MAAAAPRAPSLRQALRALDRAEECLRMVSSSWKDVPAGIRAQVLRCADAAERVLSRAGMRP